MKKFIVSFFTLILFAASCNKSGNPEPVYPDVKLFLDIIPEVLSQDEPLPSSSGPVFVWEPGDVVYVGIELNDGEQAYKFEPYPYGVFYDRLFAKMVFDGEKWDLQIPMTVDPEITSTRWDISEKLIVEGCSDFVPAQHIILPMKDETCLAVIEMLYHGQLVNYEVTPEECSGPLCAFFSADVGEVHFELKRGYVRSAAPQN